MNEQRQTLVILTPAFAEAEGDSWLPAQETFVRTVNKLFPALNIVIISFHFPEQRGRYTWYGNEVIALGGGMKGKWNSLMLWRRAWQALRQLKREQHLLGIFSFFCSESAFVGHHFAKRNDLKHHIWVLGQDAKSENKQVKRIRPSSDELVAISDFLVGEFKRNHNIRPAHMIPLGLDPEAFPTAMQHKHIDLLGVGSLIPLKQYDVFVDVAKALQQSIPGLQATICGDGPEANKLNDQISNSGLEDTIKLAGKLPQSEVISLMQRSRILLHPSVYEGFGMVCAEALFAGAQVISFCKPLKADFDGWHIVKDKQEMIAKALELLQADEPPPAPQLILPMEETALRILSLFAYKESNS